MANPHRGEVEIVLGGKTYVLRPTFDSLAAIERATDTRLLPLTRRFMELDFGIVDVAQIIQAAAVEKPPRDELGRLILEAGLAEIGGPITRFLAGALNGGREGNAETPATTPAT